MSLLFFFFLYTSHLRVVLSSHCSTITATKTFQKCMTLPTQQASLAWTFHAHNATLDLCFFGTFISPSGWVGWGINPSSPEMTGTRALVAFPDPNSGQLVLLPYILDPTVKLQKSPLLSRPLDTNLISSSATLYGGKMATIHNGASVQIFATLKLSPNKTKIHHVWNRGLYVQGYSPTIHPTTSNDLSSIATIDVMSGSTAAQHSNIKTLRMVHGIINAVAWGVLLPIGAVTARYLRHIQALGPSWFYAHSGIQLSAFFLGTVGFGIGIRLGDLSPGVVYGLHRKLGFTAFCLGALQTLALLFRPKTTNKFRKYWKSYHHFVGYACVVLGVVNVFQGFEVMGEGRSYAKLAYCLCLSTLIGVCIALEVNSWVIFCRKSKEEKLRREKTNNESRSNKYQKTSSLSVNEADNDHNLGEEEMKRKARLMRNRESAQLSRQRKKHYVEELEDKVRNMHSTIADLNSKISFFMAENASLKQQLSGSNAMPPPLGMYPPLPHMAAAPMPYGWMPCAAPYMVKPQGSQVPLVPIPRLKPQAAAAVPPRTKKSDGNKSKSDGSKTKKVASVSFLGLLFFILLFGGLVPLVDVKYGGIRDGVSGGYFSSGFYNQHRGRVLTINVYSNGSGESMGIGFPNGRVGFDNRIHCARAVESKEKESQPAPDSDEFVRPCNASEPLVASLYVPRNDKLVKIDGNLIIHSVLASEKAMASHDASKANSKEATGLAIPKDFSPALAIPDVRGNGARHSHFYRNPAERQRAISSGSTDALKDHMKSSAANGKLQQWFQEGLSGPLLSSGMCTEVFQFDASPAPGAIIPASSVANMTAEHRQNATQVNRGRNRRILHRLPVPLTNITGERKAQKESFAGNKSASSMVVSVLVDPRETGDGDVEGMISPKSLSRIFVVVLLDSVKYVTYSCGLPRSGLHLVTG